jgi:hypothetical protein
VNGTVVVTGDDVTLDRITAKCVIVYGASNLTVRRSNLSGAGTAAYADLSWWSTTPAGDDLLNGGEDVVDAFSRAARRGRFRAVRFDRFWASMDTLKERMALEEMHRSGNRPRAVWGREARTMADHAASSSSLRFPCDWPGPHCKEDR